MIEAGVEVLLRDGIGVGATTFRYRDAFARLADDGIKVTRGSVHERIWSTQLAWQLDVLSELIARNDQERRLAIANAITEPLLALPTETMAQRQLVMAEAARLGGLVFVDSVTTNTSYRLFPALVAAWKASNADLPEHDRLGEILRDLQRMATQRFRSEVTVLVGHLDLRANPDCGLDLSETLRAYCAISTSLAFAHATRLGADPALSDDIMATCPDGETRRWNILGLSNWMVGRQLFVDREMVVERVGGQRVDP